MSQVLSIRVPDSTLRRLEKFARRQGHGMTRTKAAATLLEESLREAEFPYLEYRDSAIGRQIYLKGHRLQVWMMIMIASHFDFDIARLAEAYYLPPEMIQSAFNYYEVYKDEVDEAIEANRRPFEELKRLLPNIELVEISDEEAQRALIS